MTIVAVCSAGGSAASTTTSTLLATLAPARWSTLLAECDPTGGDVGAWAQLPASPGWASAVAGADRSWRAILDNAQALPTGHRVLVAPARAGEARAVVSEALLGFGDLLAALPDVAAVTDCGTISAEPPAWVTRSALCLLLLRQGTAQATVARVERAREALDVLRPACRRVGVVLVGAAPYPPKEIERALGVSLFGSLVDDRIGASRVAGAWSLGRNAARSPLARSARELAATTFDVAGRGTSRSGPLSHRPDTPARSAGAPVISVGEGASR